MDDHVKDFFKTSSDETPRGNFHRVFALHEAPDIDCSTLCKMVPDLNKGWYELAVLEKKDRIDFTLEFWLDTLPYHKGFSEFIGRFFENLEDVGIYITQQKFDDPFEACMVYSLKGGSGFYRGGSPATEEQILELKKLYPDCILPQDYLAFLQIHNGFWKTTDSTGIARIAHMNQLYKSLQKIISKKEGLLTSEGNEVNPKTLIPFYESFGMPYFQCFWSEWYPEEEMGNIYYSDTSNVLMLAEGGAPSPENMAFPTFLDWLTFYLEKFA